jgi:2-succinyl-5-enolpyruvyl-6-hydroxy-3-cyclohexene-1-carboxylate synthase
MYSVHKNAQILIALLKKYSIRDFVISAGTRHIPVVFSIEEDDFFNCYSVVDERSAGFFALGLIEKLKRPVCIICTSGTAAANYVSAANEAFYQQLPLVILTSDRHPYYLNQQEEQCIPQLNLYKDVCKKIVNLPIVRDEKDFWYCSRLVNEALLELEHRNRGPVHINFPIDDNYPIEQGTFRFEEENLPEVIKINRLTLEEPLSMWKEKARFLKEKKVLIIYGQNGVISEEEIKTIESFCEKFNCLIATDHISNLHCAGSLNTFVLNILQTQADFKEVCPDIVITMHGNSLSSIKKKCLAMSKSFQHWHVSRDGEISDPFRCMTDIIECSPKKFFEIFDELVDDKLTERQYFNCWMTQYLNKISITDETELKYSSVYAVKGLLSNLPKDSLLHISNSSNVRIASCFPIDNSIEVFCNRGTCGIDGSMSSFVAQAYISECLCFLTIGDLSFFYDMNALWNRYIGKNIRILVTNNAGGALFHTEYYKQIKTFPNIDRHVAAEHNTSVRGWAEARGFKYLAAINKEEYDKALKIFLSVSEQPIILEVFSDKEMDVKQLSTAVNSYRNGTTRGVNELAASLPEPIKRRIKKILKR